MFPIRPLKPLLFGSPATARQRFGTASPVMQDVIAGVERFLTVVGLPPQSEAQIIAAVNAVIDDVAKVAATV